MGAGQLGNCRRQQTGPRAKSRGRAFFLYADLVECVTRKISLGARIAALGLVPNRQTGCVNDQSI